ncbi:RNA polymerase sigma factor [Crocinitomicaceae bacterium]|jgi:RNA polymerase sigma factor (sigma-70 family)|nr:RNA polymerase sigma factor [Crocinitomicaceae bacterium]MDG1346875.1 RNA polymerase sigma factor [Crocinitomicaceae bacterium]MDG2465414.1 RNA polymerase sigma factor [Crocinitomicaceae bacterium]
MNLDEIINNCKQGKHSAQQMLFDYFSPKMMTVCLRYLGNREEAEDVCQISFVKLFKNIHDYNKDGSFEGWVRRIFVNTSLDQIRKNKKTKYDMSVDDVDYKLENNDFTLEQMAAEDILKLVEEMPTGYRTVFNMFAIEGFSHKEIAHHLAITENTSKSQFKRARGYLMNSLENLQYGK